MEANGNTFQVTIVTSTNPNTLTKKYSLDEKGVLHKETSANMRAGSSQVHTLETLQDFKTILMSLGNNQAVCYGRTKLDFQAITTKGRLAKLRERRIAASRSNDCFSWSEAGAVMMIDYDPAPGEAVLSSDQLVETLRNAVPGLKETSLLWWASSSSHICHNETNLTGLRGQRIYFRVKAGSDIERTGQMINDHLWAKGHGYIVISKSGAMLLRTAVDTSVWQPSRLDFMAGADCTSPLEQRRGTPVIYSGSHEVVDTHTAIPEDPEISALAEEKREQAKRENKEKANEVKQEWIDQRVADMIQNETDDRQEKTRNARAAALKATELGILSADYQLTIIERGERKKVTVSDILEDPFHYNGCITLDPLEPEYDGGRAVGKVFINATTATLYSFAHGGRTYRLERKPCRIEVSTGNKHIAVDKSLEHLNTLPDMFSRGGLLVEVQDGKIKQLDENALKYRFSSEFNYFVTKRGKEGQYEEEIDPPRDIIQMAMSLARIKDLTAVHTAPTLRADGSILSKPGYDQETKVLLHIDEEVHVPEEPTSEEINNALQILIEPFNTFPFVDKIDWSVFLAALLTAAIRVLLPTAPGIGFDAPTQGSGKTLLAKIVAYLAGGVPCDPIPYTTMNNDEENRKRLFAALISATPAIVIDNILGTFNSVSFATALTSNTYSDRILGQSRNISVPIVAMMIFTGNNLTFCGDMPRRILTCRIDPKTETPFARKFDLDPLEYVKNNRTELIVAGLTLVRGWLTSDDYKNNVRAPGRLASFETWDDLVRQTVAWLARTIDAERFCDPMDAITNAVASDPQREADEHLLKVLFGCFPKGATVQEILHRAKPDDYYNRDGFLMDAILGVTPKDKITAVSLGKLLQYRDGKPINGFRLESRTGTNNTKRWYVFKVDQDGNKITTDPDETVDLGDDEDTTEELIVM